MKYLLLTISVFLSTLNAFGQQTFTQDGMKFTVLGDGESVSVAANDHEITAADIPSSVLFHCKTYQTTAIEANGFQSCSKLTSVSVPSSIREVGDAAFWECRHVASIEMAFEDAQVGNNVFHGCVRLTSVVLPRHLAALGEGLFWGCKALEEMEIPATVTTLHDKALYGCTALKAIRVLATTPPAIDGDNVFAQVNKESCVLYVPKGTSGAYG